MIAFPVIGAEVHPTLKGERPMLARVADSVYWMSRYVERAEHIARMLVVSGNLLADAGDLAPELRDELWLSVLRVVRVPDAPVEDGPIARRVLRQLAFDQSNPSSIFSCITRARENARAVREIISAEMWEQLNTLYWYIRIEDAERKYEQQSDDFLRAIMNGSMLFQGLAEQTLPHDQRWLFTTLGKHLERADITSRILETRHALLGRITGSLEASVRTIHWMAVLRMCCSLEAYRRQFVADFDGDKVCAFVTLEQQHPRAIRYSLDRALESIASIRALLHPHAFDPAERVLGRLQATHEYADPAELFAPSFGGYMQQIQQAIGDTAIAVQQTYFLQ